MSSFCIPSTFRDWIINVDPSFISRRQHRTWDDVDHPSIGDV